MKQGKINKVSKTMGTALYATLMLARFAVYVGLCVMGCKCLYEHDVYRSLAMFALAFLIDIAERNSK